MRNNDFITRNFTAGNSVATVNNVVAGTAPLNIVVFGVQAVDTAGKYMSKLTSLKPFSNRPEDGDKVLFQYELMDAAGVTYFFREVFSCSAFVDRWNQFGRYLVSEHGIDGNCDISTLVGLEEIVTLGWVEGHLNVVHIEKCPENFDNLMLEVKEEFEQ